MSKKRDFERLARRAGIIRPMVEYKRKLGYIISIGDVPLTNRKGYTSLEVGLYQSVESAKEGLQEDIQQCVDRNIAQYPDLLERVTPQYHPVTLSDKDTTHQLLASLLDDPKTAEAARTAIDYIESLESQIQSDSVRPKGTYTSKYPDQQKKQIDWQQPDYREHPVYTFEIDCPYCGQQVILERHSHRQPAHCGQPNCAKEHDRALARERKRRQRQRQKRDE